jgi:hypothetical protein
MLLPSETASKGKAGFTPLELCVAMVVAGILLAAASTLISRYGSNGKVAFESSKLADKLWTLRSKATTGMAHPCLDFPDNRTVRLYRDINPLPDGFGAMDAILDTYRFSGSVRALSVSGGTGPTHFVCFQSNGVIGSAMSPLTIILGSDQSNSKRLRLLPATGMVRIQ